MRVPAHTGDDPSRGLGSLRLNFFLLNRGLRPPGRQGQVALGATAPGVSPSFLPARRSGRRPGDPPHPRAGL